MTEAYQVRLDPSVGYKLKKSLLGKDLKIIFEALEERVCAGHDEVLDVIHNLTSILPSSALEKINITETAT